MKSILVLLSTYNGELYLEAQLESLLKQKGVKLNILIRDDGSTDKTIDIIKKYAAHNDNFKWYEEENLKSAKSFWNLLQNAGEYDYYAFCDQDDVWDSRKLVKAIEKIEKNTYEEPVLYASSLSVVDQDLNYMFHKSIDKSYTFCEALQRNNLVGCTMVFNNRLFNILKKYTPNYLEMHDSWAHRVCLAIGGKVIVDNNAYIKYRQHSSNVIGANNKKIIRLYKRYNLMIKGSGYRATLTAQELLKGYGNLISNEKKAQLVKLIEYDTSLKNKFGIIIDKDFNCGKNYQKILFCIDVIFNNL